MKRETLRSIITILVRLLSTVEYRGTEHVPPEGGLVITTNHMSRVDTLLLFINPVRTDITALVATKYLKYPLFKWILNTGGIVWLERDTADFTAFRLAVDEIKAGKALGIAPEGTRSQTGELQEGKPGAILLAMKTNVPIVPVAIAGTETFFKKLFTLRRPKVKITFGPAYMLPALDRSNRDESLKRMAEEVMLRIAILLPPKYWGVYKDNPRLKEMLENKSQYV